MTNIYEFSVRDNISDEFDPTFLLKVVLIINFIFILLLGLGSLILLLYAMTQIATCAVHGIDTVIWLLIGFLPFLLTLLYLKLVLAIQEYNNVARMVLVIIFGSLLIVSMFYLNILPVLISSFVIYVLTFHKKTKKLFLAY